MDLRKMLAEALSEGGEQLWPNHNGFYVVDDTYDLTIVAKAFLAKVRNNTRPDAVYGVRPDSVFVLPEGCRVVHFVDGTRDAQIPAGLPPNTFTVFIGPLGDKPLIADHIGLVPYRGEVE